VVNINLRMPRLLLVNPWIFDFAACDFWLKPMGLLALGSALRDAGFDIDLVDLTGASAAPDGKIHKRRPDGRGKFYAEEIEKPAPLQGVKRKYKRYGLLPAAAAQVLKELPRPDAILMAATLTYWSLGYAFTAQFLRQSFPQTPLIAGGLYVTVCAGHARENLHADFLCEGDYETGLPPVLKKIFGARVSLPGPEQVRLALDLYPRLDYGVLLTGRGCPFRCKYCVGWKLHPVLRRKPVAFVVEEIAWQAKALGLKNLAFYDDALILEPEQHIMPILEGVLCAGLALNFHVPNGIHLKPMNAELARLMKRSGFKTIRFGLETADAKRQEELGAKAGLDDLEAALGHLEKAGFRGDEIIVYLLAGLPGQTAREVERDVLAVKKLGARPSLSEYSPIPGTDLWQESLAAARYDFENEPLLQNCSLLPCGDPSLNPREFSRLKSLCRQPA